MSLDSLIISTFDIKGGAARAAFRLHTGLKAIGVNSHMLVRRKMSSDPDVTGATSRWGRGLGYFRELVDSFPLRFYKNKREGLWGLGWKRSGVWRIVKEMNPGIVHLHWIGGGFVSLDQLAKFNRPIVWTLHDMWAFTGGCHYAGECKRYKESCGMCPELGSTKETDLSRKFRQRKKEAYKGLNLTIVTPSQWLAQCVRQSSLLRDFPVKVIPNGLDLELFKPVDRRAAREKLDLPVDKKLILFGAVSSTSDWRKGFHLLQPALRFLSANRTAKDVELLVFGSDQPENPPDFGLPARYLGTLSDEEQLALLYAAADVCTAPSLQDNLPNIVAEAMACGTPCVAFDIGGMPDMIDHKKNGYLARPFDAEDLARGMAWVLQQENLNPRQKAEEMLGLVPAAKKYKELYDLLITTKSTHDTKGV